MRFIANIAVSVLAVLLLAAPAVWACCDAGTMASPCPMGSMQQDAGAAMSMTMPCHAGDRMSADCCDLEWAPTPVATRALEVAPPLVALDVRAPLLMAPPLPVDPTARSAPPRSSRLHDLGRYTLFSAFLL